MRRSLSVLAVLAVLALSGCALDEPAASSPSTSDEAVAEVVAEEPAPEPADVVGLPLDEARAELVLAGFTVDAVDVREDRGIFMSSNWVVVDQAVDGTTVTLGVEKFSDRDEDAATTEPDDEGDAPEDTKADFAAAVEASLLSAFGVDQFTELCVDLADSWPCYVAGVEAPTSSAVVGTLQITEDDREFGDQAAFAILSLVGTEHEGLDHVQVRNATGTYIGDAVRRDIPLLNR